MKRARCCSRASDCGILLQQLVGVGDHVAEGAQIVLLQHALHSGEDAGDLPATPQDFFVGQGVRVLRPRHARNGQLAAFQLLNVFRIFLRADQFVVAAPHELEQIIEKLADVGGADEIVQVQFANALAQINPEILVVEYARTPGRCSCSSSLQ